VLLDTRRLLDRDDHIFDPATALANQLETALLGAVVVEAEETTVVVFERAFRCVAGVAQEAARLPRLMVVVKVELLNSSASLARAAGLRLHPAVLGYRAGYSAL